MNNLALEALEYYGIENQILKATEECGELIQVLAKYSAFLLKTKNEMNPLLFKRIHEELADVEIMMDQMKIYFGIEGVELMVVAKKSRLAMRISADKQSGKK